MLLCALSIYNIYSYTRAHVVLRLVRSPGEYAVLSIVYVYFMVTHLRLSPPIQFDQGAVQNTRMYIILVGLKI